MKESAERNEKMSEKKMRRVFVIRKDLHLSPGKLAAMVGHCCEAYWTNLIKANCDGNRIMAEDCHDTHYAVTLKISIDIMDDYVHGIFTKTICECRNKAQLKKAEDVIETLKAEGVKLVQGEDYGYINDSCLTELAPENSDGTTTIGMWFRPLPDDIAHKISKKFQLYRA